MKNLYRIFALSALVGFSFTGCSVIEQDVKSSEPICIEFLESSPASYSVETKTSAVTTLSSVYVSATQGSTVPDTFAFENEEFSGPMSGMTGDAYWPRRDGEYKFFASNVELDGTSVSASNTTDVVVGKLTSPTYKRKNSITLEHIFSRLYSVNVIAESGYTITNVNISITPKTGGDYDIKTDSWSNLVTGSAINLVSSTPGTSTPDLYLVPGSYTVNASWTATIGDYTEDIVAESLEFTFEAGNKNTIEFTLGGNAVLLSYKMGIVPWGSETVTPNGSVETHPLTFEIISAGTITWKCSNASIAKTIKYSKNGGAWTDLTSTTAGASITVAAGDILEFVGDNAYYGTSSYYNNFGGTAKFYVYGDLQSLMNYSKTINQSYCYYRLFYNNTNIDLSPEKDFVLSAKTLASDCYSGMFSGCTSLTIAPELSVTTLQSACYRDMFNGCTSLTAAPELPATTLQSSCYSFMFSGCTGLFVAPELPATTLQSSCYSHMFQNCTSLTSAPELPATTLASDCYSYMFKGCTSLSVAPELPATTLQSACYRDMFNGCTSLTAAPELPATTLRSSCYCDMFQGCTSLTVAPELPATTLADGCYSSMFYGCTSLTSAPELPATTLASQCYHFMFRDCKSLTVAPELPATTLQSSCYSYMFCSCTSLTSAPELPATTLASGCYFYMFQNCTSLITAPELPATTLQSSCYSYMFQNCTSLITAPELPATTLASDCYSYMFKDCKSLTAAPELPATTLSGSCYQQMFYGCSSLTVAPELPATTLASGCYSSMFSRCTSLTVAPELPTTTLVNNCYNQMFNGCSNLSYVKCLATNISASGCVTNWLSGVKSTGTFVKASSMTSWPSGINGVPTGWTVQDAS